MQFQRQIWLQALKDESAVALSLLCSSTDEGSQHWIWFLPSRHIEYIYPQRSAMLTFSVVVCITHKQAMDHETRNMWSINALQLFQAALHESGTHDSQEWLAAPAKLKFQCPCGMLFASSNSLKHCWDQVLMLKRFTAWLILRPCFSRGDRFIQ